MVTVKFVIRDWFWKVLWAFRERIRSTEAQSWEINWTLLNKPSTLAQCAIVLGRSIFLMLILFCFVTSHSDHTLIWNNISERGHEFFNFFSYKTVLCKTNVLWWIIIKTARISCESEKRIYVITLHKIYYFYQLRCEFKTVQVWRLTIQSN